MAAGGSRAGARQRVVQDKQLLHRASCPVLTAHPRLHVLADGGAQRATAVAAAAAADLCTSSSSTAQHPRGDGDAVDAD